MSTDVARSKTPDEGPIRMVASIVPARPNWCRNPNTPIERLICKDAGLLEQQQRVTDLYESVMTKPAQRMAARREVRRWVENREACASRLTVAEQRDCTMATYESWAKWLEAALK